MAARFWVGGGSSANWNATGNTNWSASSGGANNASVPGTSDSVTFDVNGNVDSILSANVTVQSFTVTSGYTATITHNATLTLNLSGTMWVMNGTHTIAGTGQITIACGNNPCSINLNGSTWPNNLAINDGPTITLLSNAVIGGTTSKSASFVCVINGASYSLSTSGITVSAAVSNGSASIANCLS